MSRGEKPRPEDAIPPHHGPGDEEKQRDKAQDQFGQAEADLGQAGAELARQRKLTVAHAASQRELELLADVEEAMRWMPVWMEVVRLRVMSTLARATEPIRSIRNGSRPGSFRRI